MILVCIVLLFLFVHPWWIAALWSIGLVAVRELLWAAVWRWG